MQSVLPELNSATADRAFVFDGSPDWTPAHGLAVLEAKGAVGLASVQLEQIRDSAHPVPKGWLADRLTALWTMFTASRREANAGAVTIWMAEYIRLLDDLPWDIVAVAIDDAVRNAKHGFMPAVGEIRAIANPLVENRKRLIERLSATVEYLSEQSAK